MDKHDRFPSNWELSGARAAAVVRFFIEKGHIDPARLTFAGYAEYHPLQPNRPFLGNPENRRVEIVILRTKEDMIEPPIPSVPENNGYDPESEGADPGDNPYPPLPSHSMLPDE
jgi:chemotaxis protein MotB